MAEKEYIEREAAMDAMLKQPPDAHYPEWYARDIREIPTADAVEVRHGEWTYECAETSWGENLIHEHCSLCGWKCHRLETRTPVNYCPNCGAKMDGREVEYAHN